MLFLWWQSRIFFIITPVFSVAWSFRNHNLFDSQETFLIIINVETILLLHILCGNGDNFIFQDFLINIKFNEQHLFAFIKYIN